MGKMNMKFIGKYWICDWVFYLYLFIVNLKNICLIVYWKLFVVYKCVIFFVYGYLYYIVKVIFLFVKVLCLFMNVMCNDV